MKYKIGDVISYKTVKSEEIGEIVGIKYENNELLYILNLKIIDIETSVEESEIKKI